MSTKLFEAKGYPILPFGAEGAEHIAEAAAAVAKKSTCNPSDAIATNE